jgi:hypothetical protein
MWGQNCVIAGAVFCLFYQIISIFLRNFMVNPLPREILLGIFGAMMNFVTCATLNRRWWRGL